MNKKNLVDFVYDTALPVINDTARKYKQTAYMKEREKEYKDVMGYVRSVLNEDDIYNNFHSILIDPELVELLTAHDTFRGEPLDHRRQTKYVLSRI